MTLKEKDIAVLIPTLNRPTWLYRVLASLKLSAPATHCVVATDEDDRSSQSVAFQFDAQLVILDELRGGQLHGWNEALRAAPIYGAYVLGSDDVYFVPGWLEKTLEALSEIRWDGVVGFNDCKKYGERESEAEHFLMTRNFMIKYNCGVMVFECYDFWFSDMETGLRAKRAKKYIWAQEAWVPHLTLHPDGDETYRLMFAHGYEKNKAIFDRRKRLGWPNDVKPIIK